ncbi:MAG: tRNA uridine-5-carboxymethylaminomethyl(34) synthesis GTPase MnmE [Bacteroidia bacterium]
MQTQNTIAALATHPGMAAIAVIRICGPTAFEVIEKVFRPVGGKKLSEIQGYTIVFGKIHEEGKIIDEVLVSVFRAPHSYTGDDTLEISCHGSVYIQQEILQLLYRSGAEPALPGAFTLRAFLNGKMDLSQAEAVPDLIASGNQASHAMAMQQLRGGFGNQIKKLRENLLNFLALIELELDFSTEDVEFADRNTLETLVKHILGVIERLRTSYAMGNVLKNGIPVAIVGMPNAGKSTLLNALLNEERAIVSDIAGTTRDTVEDEVVLGGFGFRFIDTAGLRETTDTIERIGIERSRKSIREAAIVLYVFEPETWRNGTAISELQRVENDVAENVKILQVLNKCDVLGTEFLANLPENTLRISAQDGHGIEALHAALVSFAQKGRGESDFLVSNARHYTALSKASEGLQAVLKGLELRISGDLLSRDLRDTLDALSEITGEVDNEEVLGTIFGKFCIGK